MAGRRGYRHCCLPHAAQAAAAEPEAELVGTYAVKQNGALKELIKIEKQGDRYMMRDKVRTPEWSEPKMQMKPVTREQWASHHHRQGEHRLRRHGERAAQGIFKVPAGWKKNGFQTSTGYFLFYSRGPVEAYKLGIITGKGWGPKMEGG